MHRGATALTTVLLTIGLLAGCSGRDGTDSAASGDSAGMAAMAEPAAPADGDAQAGGGGGTTASRQVVDLRAAPGRAVIRTADLSVRVDDVRAAAEQAAQLTRAAGGQVGAEERTGTASSGSALLSLRVPPEAFDDTIAALARLGDERSRQLRTEDVQEQVVDLEARLATQRASVDRVRALLAEADALGEVVQIEGELTKRIADLESLEARLESLNARVELATIVLHLDSEGGPVVGEALGFGDGLRSGWAALTTAGRLVAVTTGALLPFLPLLLVAGYLALRVRSRRSPGADAAVVTPT